VKRLLLAAACGLALGGALGAADFGLLLDTAAAYGAPETKAPGPGFSGGLSPWFSLGIPERLSFFFSASVSLSRQDRLWDAPLIELERTELNIRPLPALYLSLGRLYFRDPAGLVAAGLFDGASVTAGLGMARITGAAFYTGFLYKKTAGIVLSQEDSARYDLPQDYGNLDTYFASRRLLAALTAGFPDLSPRVSLEASALAQFDLNDVERPLHGQYLEVLCSLEAADTLRLNLSGIGAAAEQGSLAWGLAFLGGAEWAPPGALRDLVTGEFFWGSGAVTEELGPLRPVSGITRGMVFTPALSALMDAHLSYRARPGAGLSAEAQGSLFWRTDLETLKDRELDSASASRFLGGEFYGQAVWAPQSALRLSAGAGLFIPGPAFKAGAKLRWKAELSAVVSL
jgi:hypothetical protein